jgi:succinoglycan biosynthesis transport protein ExoP
MVIIVVTLIFAAAAYLISARQQTTYSAEASLSLREPTEDFDLLGAPLGLRGDREARAALSARLATGPDVARRVKRALRTDLSVDALRAMVSARPEARTNLVVIQARAGTPPLTARLANAFARQFSIEATEQQRDRLAAAIRSIRERLEVARSLGDPGLPGILRANIARLQALHDFGRPVTVTEVAEVPGKPVSPKPVRNGLLGGLIGLTLGLIAAFARDALDRRLRGVQEIQEQLRLPLLTQVSEEGMGHAGRVTNGRGPLPDQDLEAFRILRANLRFLDRERSLQSIAVTSALAEEGKTTVATSLAWVSAAAGKRTLLVECDLRRPALAERMGLRSTPGLIDYLAGRAEARDILQSIYLDAEVAAGIGGDGRARGERRWLHCITAGRVDEHATEILESQGFRDFLREVTDAYDAVVLDTSPLLPVGDTLEVVPSVDAVLICVRSSQTTRDQARAVKAALDHFPSRPTGLVITGVQPGDYERYGYYSHYEGAAG